MHFSFLAALLLALLAALALQAASYALTRVEAPALTPELAALSAEHALWLLGVLLLRPGHGPLAWRVLRPVLWGGLASAAFAALVGPLAALVPPTRSYLEFQALAIPDPSHFVAASLIAFVRTEGLRFTTAYAFRAVWLEGNYSLRWRLTALALGGGVLASALVASLPRLVALVSDPTKAATSGALADARQLADYLQPALAKANPEESIRSFIGFLEALREIPRGAAAVESDVPLLRPPNYRSMLVFAPNGAVVASVEAKGYQPSNSAPGSNPDPWAEVRAAALTGRCRAIAGGSDEFAGCPVLDASGRVLFVAGVVRPSIGGRVLAADVVAQIAHDLTTVLDRLSQAFLPIFLVLGFIAWAAAQRLTARLDALLALAGALARGSYGQRVPVDAEDEVGRLAAGFNVMAARLEENVRAIASEKERAEAALSANRVLTASASHELRTPLAVMRAHLESAEMRGAPLGADETRVLSGEVLRLERLVDDLFALSRAQVGKLEMRLEAVPLDEVIEALAIAVQPLADANHVTLLRNTPQGLPPAKADRARLQQAALNLLQNALRYTPEGGLVMLEAAAEGGRVLLTVADTGIGLSPEDLEHAFEPFYRADKARARESGGSGLGLALVQQLVQGMGGTVSAESDPGRGSRFSIVLPAAQQPEPAVAGGRPERFEPASDQVG